MVHVTTRARSELFSRLVRALARCSVSDLRTVGFRLVPGDEEHAQLILALDASREGDAVVEHNGRSVLLIEPFAADLLKGLTLDTRETSAGVRLLLRS
jgi:hypothetical protein